MPRWLWVAIGDGLDRPLDLLGVEALRRRAVRGASPATISWAQGQAVMPWAWTPVRVRVPRSEATAVPKST